MPKMTPEQAATVREVFAKQLAVPRSVRVTDDLWEAAKETAERRGETVSDVIVKALAGYVKRHK